jgi:hypothetical protein
MYVYMKKIAFILVYYIDHLPRNMIRNKIFILSQLATALKKKIKNLKFKCGTHVYTAKTIMILLKYILTHNNLLRETVRVQFQYNSYVYTCALRIIHCVLYSSRNRPL